MKVLWVKGSGGDLGSIKRSGFATLYMDKLLALEHLYRGQDTEDAMVEMYALCSFRNNPVASSIDTPLHGFLPFPHVDHLHPDWGIALAASANGKEKMEEFNREFDHRLIWIPWQRPGFELAMMLKRAVEQNPGCDGIVLGAHGLFTWGETQRECYVNTITVIDQLGQFIASHAKRKGETRFGGEAGKSRPNRHDLATEILPFLRGRVSAQRRWIASFSDHEDVLALCELCSCPGPGFSGHELSRPLHPHQDSPHVCSVGRRRRCGDAEEPDRVNPGGISRAISQLLSGVTPYLTLRPCATPAPPSC